MLKQSCSGDAAFTSNYSDHLLSLLHTHTHTHTHTHPWTKYKKTTLTNRRLPTQSTYKHFSATTQTGTWHVL